MLRAYCAEQVGSVQNSRGEQYVVMPFKAISHTRAGGARQDLAVSSGPVLYSTFTSMPWISFPACTLFPRSSPNPHLIPVLLHASDRHPSPAPNLAVTFLDKVCSFTQRLKCW